MEFSTKVVEEVAKILVQELEKVETGDQGIMGLETNVRQMLKLIGAEALRQYLSRKDPAGESKDVTCECGGQAQFHSWREAVILSVFGKVQYQRRYYVCSKCHKGQSPCDEQMGLAPGEVTAGLAKLLGLAGVEMAYEEATRLVEQFLLIEVSDNTLRKETECFGRLQAAEEKQWEQASQNESHLQTRLREMGPQKGRLYGSIDGAIVPLHGEWRELKSVAWYRVEKVVSYRSKRHHPKRVGEQNHLQAREISYACDIREAESFGSLVWATGWKRRADLQEELIFICDGASWIWRLVEKYFPSAIQIVDWYHASEYLSPVAEAAFGSQTPQATAWLEQARTDLWEGRIPELIQECQRLARCFPAAAEAVHKTITYYSNNQKRMDYGRLRAQGYLIGSGTIESGCKHIAGFRLKLAGARWTFDGSVQTAKARAAWLSGDWDTLAVKRAALPFAV
jgi:hypothetical protein